MEYKNCSVKYLEINTEYHILCREEENYSVIYIAEIFILFLCELVQVLLYIMLPRKLKNGSTCKSFALVIKFNGM